MAWYEPDSFHINDGAVESGNIVDTYTNNGIRHTLDEVTGTPGFDYEYWFETIPGTVNWFRVKVNGYYEGNPAHIVDIQVWNYTTSAWVDVDVMLDDTADNDYYSPDLNADDYSSGGQAKVRFYHASAGNTSHDLHLDQVVLEDRSSEHSTAAPTTAPPTTVEPSTLAPTTTLTTAVPTTTLTTAPPTTTLTTVAPTTAWGEDITPGPIVITLSQYFVFNYNPPAPVNPGLDQEADWGPIEITITPEFGGNLYVGVQPGPIEIVVTPEFDNFNIGTTINVDPVINIVITPRFMQYLIELDKCNFIKWSKIGRLDFTIDESNLAGERPVDWKGCIWHVRKLNDKVVAYGENGVSFLTPSGVHWGLNTVYRIGLKNKGAFVGTDFQHFFVDNLGQLFQVDNGITKLDYSEFLSTMGTIILSLDVEKNLLYICDGTNGYVYGIATKSFGEGPANITGIGAQSNNIYVVSYEPIVTPKFEICTDIYDLGTRKPKTIHAIEIGSNMSEFLYASVDYRTAYKDDFKQIGWFLVNPRGKAFPKCYGVEFRFRIKSTVYEYFELDYLNVRGHIHGFSWTDTEKVEGY